jgi:hypothetical protein
VVLERHLPKQQGFRSASRMLWLSLKLAKPRDTIRDRSIDIVDAWLIILTYSPENFSMVLVAHRLRPIYS